MDEIYDPAAVEAAAQQHWRALDAYRSKENDPRFPKGKYYVCSMLPYPSGKLHMGHMRNYTLNDVVYRFMRSSGYNVMTPWVGTRLACPPKMPLSTRRSLRRSGRARTSPT